MWVYITLFCLIGHSTSIYFGTCRKIAYCKHNFIDLFHLPTLMLNSFIHEQYVCYTTILDMFRASTCPSSVGQIVLSQHLVSSLSVRYSTVCRMRADYRAVYALIRHTLPPFTESDDTSCCDNTICSPEDGHVNARNMSRIVM